MQAGMKTALHLMVVAGLLGLQVSVPASGTCPSKSGGEADSCCCTPAPQVDKEAPSSCCSADPDGEAAEPREHHCTCSVGPSPAVPPETDPVCVLSSKASLIHVIHVTQMNVPWLEPSFTPPIPGQALDAGPPGDLPPAYQWNCVYLR